jgi:hypothetical protein
MPSIEVTSNAFVLNIPVQLQGNLGIGTSNPIMPLHVEGATIKAESAVYSSVAYEDYTTWDAYLNRISLVPNIVPNLDDGSVLLPDFGFDFYIKGQNYRSSTYVTTNSYFTFGESLVEYNINPYTFTMPALFIAGGDYEINNPLFPSPFISYYVGVYNGDPAMYVFYSGSEVGTVDNLNVWCVIFTPQKISIVIQSTELSEYMVRGLWSGNNWLIQLPGNESGQFIYNKSYEIDIIDEKNNALLALGKVGIGTKTPQATLHVYGTTIHQGNIGIGHEPAYRLDVEGIQEPILSGSFAQDELYQNYSTSVAYANRINLPISGTNNDSGFAILPDLGFDYYLQGQNVRSNNIYISTNSYITFINPSENPISVFSIPDINDPAIFIAAGNSVANSISYYISNDDPSIGATTTYIFFDGYDQASGPSSKIEWAALFINANGFVNTKIMIKQVQGNYVKSYGVWDGRRYLFRYPQHATNSTYSQLSYTAQMSTPNGYGNAMLVNGNTHLLGEVGIGVTNTLATLDVRSPSYYIDLLRIQNTNNIGNTPFIINRRGNVGIGTEYPNTKLHIIGDTYAMGNIGIGTTTPSTALTVNGTIRNINGPSPTSGTSLVITANGDIAPQSSDSRYKTNVEDIPPVLDALMNVRAVSYNWKDDTTTKWYGLLAQQLSQVFPDAAWYNAEKDTYGVHYTPSIVTLLLKAVQELKVIVTTQSDEIQELKNMLSAHIT